MTPRWFYPADGDHAAIIKQVEEQVNRIYTEMDNRFDALMPRVPHVDFDPERDLDTVYTVDQNRLCLGLYTVTLDVNASNSSVTPYVGRDSGALRPMTGSGLSAAILLGLVQVEVGGTQQMAVPIPPGWAFKLVTGGGGTAPVLTNAVEVLF